MTHNDVRGSPYGTACGTGTAEGFCRCLPYQRLIGNGLWFGESYGSAAAGLFHGAHPGLPPFWRVAWGVADGHSPVIREFQESPSW